MPANGLPEPATVALGALKPAEDGPGLVLRVYEPQGARGPLRLRAPAGWRVAGAVDLLERRLDPPATRRHRPVPGPDLAARARRMTRPRRVACDVAVIGGSLGGVAAALAACEAGRTVVLTEASDWLGGQVTSQGVTPLDEHEHIERFGGTARYLEFRERARRHYRDAYGAPERMPDGAPLNPGNGWVSRLCFEPRVALAVLEAMLARHREGGRLTVLLEHEPVSAETEADTVRSVRLRGPDGAPSTSSPPTSWTRPTPASCCR
jgi:hypothetical protein